MSDAERHARKQVLLTRIAFQRNELRREFAQVRHATEPGRLLRALVGDSFGGAIGRTLFGAGPGASGDLLAQGLAWLRRYRVAAALVGSAMPFLRGGGKLRRLVRVGAIAGSAWLGWHFLQRQKKP